ncbi:erythromycin esterase family protein [Bacteroides sp. 224]|uniref:erythromycin esterase family protein n=1 Tax=Bacteroides sp. 224 TaxID=2302936 RepID=UPI0013D6341E|nr:erythromycin esterase family protein [Bacteroides sp. 224]
MEAQSFSEKYDLEFRKFNNCSWGWPGKFGKFTSLSIDSTIQVNGKYPLKLSSSLKKYKSVKSDMYTTFSLMQIVVLPSYKKEANCIVSLRARMNISGNAFLVVRGFDQREQVLFEDSVSLNNGEWSENVLSFKLSSEKAIEININYYGNDQLEQDIWLDKISIKIAGKDIGKKSVFAIDKQIAEEVNESFKEEYIIPLSENDETLFSVFSGQDVEKQIVALGECTHGSYTIKQSIYSLIKSLIEKSNVRLVLFELPSDMLLKYDLYAQGFTSEDYINKIEQDARCFFHDYTLIVELLIWIRTYNQTHDHKVHFGGFDEMPISQFALHQYYSVLINKDAASSYLELIKGKKFDELLKQTRSDVHLKEKLGIESFEYLLFMLQKNIPREDSVIFDHDKKTRDFNMADRVKNTMRIFLKDGEKVLLHAHSGHLAKKTIIGNGWFPMGYFLNDWYKEKYFVVSFQVVEGVYTDNECDQTSDYSMVCPLPKPLPQSFESVSTKFGMDYFYYPSARIGRGIVLLNQMGRNSCNRRKEVFICLKEHFDGYVLIKESEPLKNVEDNPVSYMMRYVKQ